MAGPGKPGRPKKPTPEYTYKPDKGVEAVGKEVIAELHPALSRAVIKWGLTPSMKTGFGTVCTVSEKFAIMLDRDVQFIVVVDAGKWEKWSAEDRRKALSFLLCSCSYDEMKARIIQPDLKMHRKAMLDGLYPPEVEEMIREMQMHLPGLTKITASEVPQEKVCVTCDRRFTRNPGESASKWAQRQFCNNGCYLARPKASAATVARTAPAIPNQ